MSARVYLPRSCPALADRVSHSLDLFIGMPSNMIALVWAMANGSRTRLMNKQRPNVDHKECYIADTSPAARR
jgi:hypothetical protein